MVKKTGIKINAPTPATLGQLFHQPEWFVYRGAMPTLVFLAKAGQ